MKLTDVEKPNQPTSKIFFQNRDQSAARSRLRMARAYRHQPQELSSDDFRNISASIQWCYDNEQREQLQMVIDFAVCMGDFFDQQGYWKEGVYLTNLALKASDILIDEKVRPFLFFEMGLLHDRQGKLIEAEQHYKASIELARKSGETEILANALHRLGWIAHSRRDYSQAASLYREAKSLRKTLDPRDPLALSRSWHQLGILAQDLGNPEQAKAHYQKALAIREQENAAYLKAASLHQLGALAVEKKEWEQAQNYFFEALSIRRNLKDRAGEAQALDQLGVIAQQLYKWEIARDRHVSSLKLKEELNDIAGLMRTKLHLGEVCLGQQDLEQARGWFEDCLKDNQTLEDPYYESQGHLHLGQVFFLMSAYEEAEAHYQLSLETLSNLDGMLREKAGILYQLGLIAHNVGKFDMAYQKYQGSLRIQEQEGFIIEAAMTHLQLGMIYQSYDIYDAARYHYETCRAVFEEEKVPPHYLAQTIYRLGNIAELTRQPDLACRYYTQAKKLYQTHNLPLPEKLPAALERVEPYCTKT